MTDRRDPGRQHPRTGGYRKDDPPLTTRECATWLGVEPEWVRDAINQGVWSAEQGRLVQLTAEYLPGRNATSKGEYRIYIDDFIVFLIAIGWSRLPAKR